MKENINSLSLVTRLPSGSPVSYRPWNRFTLAIGRLHLIIYKHKVTDHFQDPPPGLMRCRQSISAPVPLTLAMAWNAKNCHRNMMSVTADVPNVSPHIGTQHQTIRPTAQGATPHPHPPPPLTPQQSDAGIFGRNEMSPIPNQVITITELIPAIGFLKFSNPPSMCKISTFAEMALMAKCSASNWTYSDSVRIILHVQTYIWNESLFTIKTAVYYISMISY